MIDSYVCATETSAYPDLVKDCRPFPHPSGGWINESLTGSYFWLWHEASSLGGMYSIHDWALFEVPNQTMYAIVHSDYAAAEP